MSTTRFQNHAVSFRHQGELLAGTLLIPSGAGPHPAVVMIQGSGPTNRDNFGYFPPIREHFARHGIAVLCYDKPGVGGSTGDWRTQTGADRATEAIAAVQFLQNHAAINPNQIGLWGISQGGWIVPLAASLSSSITYIITVSGPGVSPAKQNMYQVREQMHQDNFTKHDIQQAMTYMQTLIEAARNMESFNAVEANILQPARVHSWYKYFEIPDAAVWEFFTRKDPITIQATMDYDPAPILARVTCPVLAIFGDRDALVPVSESVAIYESAFRKAGNQDVTIHVFPDADHSIYIAPSSHFAPNYLDLMVRWIQQRV